LERAKYSVLLDHDIYSTIRAVMGICEDREDIKVQFMVCANSTDPPAIGQQGPVYQFFLKFFPVFTREVLDVRSDLAAYLQQQESNIMVQELGQLCIEKRCFWIPCHDGWMGTETGEAEIIDRVVKSFYQTTRYIVQVERKTLGKENSSTILPTPYSFPNAYTTPTTTTSITTLFNKNKTQGGEYGSYVRVEGTITPSDYRKSAEEWFQQLQKHPDPDPETLRLRAQGRENRKQAFRDHRRRGREAEKMRQHALPLWKQMMTNSNLTNGTLNRAPKAGNVPNIQKGRTI